MRWTTIRSAIATAVATLWSGLGWRKKALGCAPATGAMDTEFSAEIVRITLIEPHPNADRLELARFEMASSPGVPTSYVVVTGRGDFQPGQLAAYFSVDCLLPTVHPAFAFLTTRLDGAGKAVYRLRAARLRGVFSQGLLVPAPDGLAFGNGCAEQFGVTYHRSEEEGNGPTAPSVKRKPQPFPIYTVDSLKKLPGLFTPDDYVYVTEKIHGTNFRFGWVPRRFLGIQFGWRFVVGSHRAIKTGNDGPGFYKERLWEDAAERMQLAERTRDYRGYVFYGELYGHTYGGRAIQDLTYGCSQLTGPRLAIFDIRTPKGHWLPPFQRKCFAEDCRLDTVPELYCGLYAPGLAEELAEGQSKLADHLREGCVVESISALSESRRKAKYVSQGYLLRKAA